jgi:putative transposase
MGRCRTFQFRLYPTRSQEAVLVRLLGLQCELYNAALEERRGAWAWERRSVSYTDQCRTLTQLREVRTEVQDYGVTVCRGSLKRLDRAFDAFFRRCAAGEVPGYPRFRSVRRFDSVQWEDTHSWALFMPERRLHLQGIGHVKVHLHRELRGKPKAITVARKGRRWWVSIRCTDVPATPLPATGRQVGIDLGVCAQVATSDGVLARDGRPGRRAAKGLAAAQRAVETKQRGSKHRQRAGERVGAAHRKIANQRRDWAHKLSRRLINNYDLICHEALAIQAMVRRPKPKQAADGTFAPNGAAAKGGLNRSILDAGWGQLLRFLAYKAEDAGRIMIAVAPHHTSQRCSRCGHVAAANRRTQAVFRCQACGHQAHADINAAINILRAGRAQQANPCEESPPN